MEEEIQAFLEIHNAFSSLENLMNSNLKTQKELKKELEDVINSPKAVYGVIKITPKESKIAKLSDKLENCNNDCEMSGELFSIISSFILENEIPKFKIDHFQKWNVLLHKFSETRIKKIKGEQKFFEQLAKATQDK